MTDTIESLRKKAAFHYRDAVECCTLLEKEKLQTSKYKVLYDHTKSEVQCCEEELTTLQKEVDRLVKRNDELYVQIAAGEAREKVLLGLTNELLHQIDTNDFVDSSGHDLKMFKAVHDLMKHSVSYTDDSALKAALAAERERIARNFDVQGVYSGLQTNIAHAIRALGDSK